MMDAKSSSKTKATSSSPDARNGSITPHQHTKTALTCSIYRENIQNSSFFSRPKGHSTEEEEKN
jgi:hypothetical protein